jgi:DNA-binding transcriptional ArsR family regulator
VIRAPAQSTCPYDPSESTSIASPSVGACDSPTLPLEPDSRGQSAGRAIGSRCRAHARRLRRSRCGRAQYRPSSSRAGPATDRRPGQLPKARCSARTADQIRECGHHLPKACWHWLCDQHDGDAPCSALDGGRPKSSMSHHFRVLREAGLVRTRNEDVQAINSLRSDELQRRFPGLLNTVLSAANR